jgi:hypothetical protein
MPYTIKECQQEGIRNEEDLITIPPQPNTIAYRDNATWPVVIA